MRRLGLKAWAWSGLAMAVAGAAGGTGCKATKATEVIPGVSTQMVVPKDLTSIRIDVEANGVIAFCNSYSVSQGGIVQLPSTLGVLPPQTGPATLVSITIRGYDEAGANGADVGTCPTSESGTAKVDDTSAMGPPRIIRRSIQTFVDGHILFLPMPMNYSCMDTDCSAMGDGFSCKGGLCLDSTVQDATTLPDFDPTLIDGTGLCFSPKDCLTDAVPAAVVDADKCIYGFPTWDSPLAGTGANVRVFYQSYTWQQNPAGGYEKLLSGAGEEEILNEDPIEGFTVVSAADAGLPEAGPTLPGVDAGPTYNSKGTLIRLAPGLCALAKASVTPPSPPSSGTATFHTISDVQIGSVCAPKDPLLPICAKERNNSAALPDSGTTTGACNVALPMDPAPSAMYLVMDQSVYMHGAYGAAGSAQALALSLSDPVFAQTFAGFTYLNDPSENDCSMPPTSYSSPVLPFGLAANLQKQIASKLVSWTASDLTSAVPASGGTCTQGTDPANGCPMNAPYCYQNSCYAPYPLDLQGAMASSGAYAEVTSFLTQSAIASPNIAGVMFIVNRAPVAGPAVPPEAQDCATPPPGVIPTTAAGCNNLFSSSTAECNSLNAIETEALDAFTTMNGLRTYFVVLGNDDGMSSAGTEPLTFFTQAAADVPQAVTTLDATALNGIPTSSSAMGDVATFLQTITKLGTCLYQLPPDVPSGTPASQIAVDFAPAGLPPGARNTRVPAVSNCTAATEEGAGAVDGWSYDGSTRLRICGPTCTALRNDVIGVAASQGAVPVTITKLCSGTTAADAGSSTGTSSGGTPDAAAE